MTARPQILFRSMTIASAQSQQADTNLPWIFQI